MLLYQLNVKLYFFLVCFREEYFLEWFSFRIFSLKKVKEIYFTLEIQNEGQFQRADNPEIHLHIYSPLI
jgi:hypothetical protein